MSAAAAAAAAAGVTTCVEKCKRVSHFYHISVLLFILIIIMQGSAFQAATGRCMPCPTGLYSLGGMAPCVSCATLVCFYLVWDLNPGPLAHKTNAITNLANKAYLNVGNDNKLIVYRVNTMHGLIPFVAA